MEEFNSRLDETKEKACEPEDRAEDSTKQSSTKNEEYF